MANDARLPAGVIDDEHAIDQPIGRLLRYGVSLSAAVVLTGAAVYLYAHGAEHHAYRSFHELPSSLRAPAAIVRSAFHGNSMSIIQLGMLLLIATPIARVVFSVAAFAVRRDMLYVVVSAIVLVVLLLSFLLPVGG